MFDAVREGKLARVYFLYGTEEYLRREFLRELIHAALPEKNRVFNLDMLYGDDFDRARLDDRLQSFPLFADRRVILLKRFDALALSGKDAVIEACAAVPEGTIFVVESDADRLGGARGKHMDAAARACGISFHCAPLSDREAKERVRGRFRRAECSITDDALEMLVESVGVRLIDLANEADKLILVAGPQSTITPKHVRAVVGSYRTGNLFAILDMLAQRPPDRVVRGVVRLIDAGEQPVFLLTMLQRRAAQLLEVALVAASGTRGARAIGARLQSRLRPFQVEKYVRQTAGIDSQRLAVLLENLCWADRMLKSSTVPGRTLITEALIAAGQARALSAEMRSDTP